MASEQVERPHYLAEHLEARGWSPARLAKELRTSQANVSRWLSTDSRKKRGLSYFWRRKIERHWGLPKDALLEPPEKAKDERQEAFLAGLSPEGQAKVIEYRNDRRALEGISRRLK